MISQREQECSSELIKQKCRLFCELYLRSTLQLNNTHVHIEINGVSKYVIIIGR